MLHSYRVNMAGDGSVQKFSFQYLSSRTFPSLELKDFQDRLQKWGMENRIHAQAFCFDQQFKPYVAEKFALDFFQSDEIMRSVKLAGSAGTISYGLGARASAVEIESIPCSTISMTMFDKLSEKGVLQEGGYIRKCLEEYVENVCLADQLRNVLVNEDYEKYDIYSEEEREEFLFRLFSHLCIGGAVCQYEDMVGPYLTHTKHLYKDLISVQKEPGSSDLHVVSQIYKIKALDSEQEVFFPDDKDHLNSFAYLVIDPVKRNVILLHHKFSGGLW
ncbi:cilia- and flagella-associated protein 300-like isoform X2 [Watersipora subatra]|uniref:cilia- and flagella-associated protein 300-like isoform X2 n=1 Tax=Watersipora subatra TaxID=2589382 RepID=UPI00355BDE5B